MKSIPLVLFMCFLFSVKLCWASDSSIEHLFETRQSDVQVSGKGLVIRVLADDLKGSRHQRFILRLDSGHTVLIAHNIDLAPRVDTLAESDAVAFYGVYEWNSKGGVVHWTHRDPGNSHIGGWLLHKGRKYE